MNSGPVGDEARAGMAFRDVVVLRVRGGFEFVRPRLDRRGFKIGGGVGVVRLDQADMLEEELVAGGLAEQIVDRITEQWPAPPQK